MKAYHEKESPSLSQSSIRCFKNIVEEPKIMARPHWHNSYEILYVKRGCGEQYINSKKFSFVPGSITIICPRDVHTTVATSEGGCEIDVLQFVGEYFGEREDMLSSLRSTVTEISDRRIRDIFDIIYKHVNTVHTGEQLILSGMLFTLCGIIIEHCNDSVPIVSKTEFVKQVCKYLNTDKDISLKSVSRIFGYSPEHFSRKFHSELGISYKEYSEGIRMQRFVKLFDDANISLAQIAEMLGYSDESSAIRAFKRIYGITPGAYKKLKYKQT